MISSEKKVVEYFEKGFKLQKAQQFKRYFYYLTNRKDTELTVAKNVIEKMKSKGIISSDDDYIAGVK